ncbi:2,5-diketo-D-gluconate reductase A [Arcanobacterium pluranimalium]|uniref:aldo/keto reductase n=1 Tax=Arcanobacterium pluranimalium TaxID=108028 RepID=UPI00195B41B2|nr:aldo/keto reductase [Arcanobacterium pluranimalium]MBM7824476.1 2,5-diketo-D-gluconate reductase A [Arcanobacterium pluranimalium]
MTQITATKLNTGKFMPQLGFGTYKLTPDIATEVVLEALKIGYRHIDTAQMYGNEREVGLAIKESGIPREEIFLTTKLNNGNHLPDDARRTFDESLEKLGTDYVDMFLMHWPLPKLYDGDFVTTYKVMEEFAIDKRARAIGVSNFEPHHLVPILREATIVPATNQIELHPYLLNKATAEFCRNQGIAITAWSPLGRGRQFEDPTIAEIATRIGASPAQVILAWHLQHGNIAIPKASSVERQRENFESANISLSEADMEAIDALDKGEAGRTGKHPDEMNLIPN